ncbi:MAG: ABC transporter permease [Acidobacteria bacterium]|nr:ABC transporter permease [Acidobacteriota bacterium]
MILKALALNTFKEAIRSKILYLFFIFGLFMVLGSRVISLLVIDDPVKIIKDFGLGSIHFFSILIVIILGIDLVSKEIEKKTIYNILSKPIRRWEFLLGKILGMLLTIAIVLLVMFIIFIILLWIRTGTLHLEYTGVVYMILLECLILTSFALLFSTVASQLFSTLFTLGIFIAGHSTEGLKLLKNFVQGKGIGAAFADFLYYLLPNLNNFNIKNDIVHGVTITVGVYFEATIYSIVYSALILLLSVYAFSRRNFY